ncbi:MAG: hypothetical protein JNJ45_11955 [Chthonomonas sp.]|nr:hypothetical protein [Chthonomonas sp.]
MKSFLAAVFASAVTIAGAQIPGLKGPKIDLGVDALFKKGPAITTNIKDAKWEVTDKDDFNPPTKPIGTLARTDRGGFILQAGGWLGEMQSYCLHAGTHGPSKGEAYFYAPPKGPYEKLVSIIVENSYSKPEVPQRSIQSLLWAMMARTKFSQLSRDLQATAAKLLTAKQISDLNGGALQFLSDELMAKGLVKEPPLVRQVMEAENRLRKTFENPASTFGDLEAIAVLNGEIGWGEGSRQAPRGRWNLHPEGFYVRYLPSGYSHTQVQVWVPEGAACIGKELNLGTQIAVPGNTARQRLLQSGRFYE